MHMLQRVSPAQLLLPPPHHGQRSQSEWPRNRWPAQRQGLARHSDACEDIGGCLACLTIQPPLLPCHESNIRTYLLSCSAQWGKFSKVYWLIKTSEKVQEIRMHLHSSKWIFVLGNNGSLSLGPKQNEQIAI